MLINGSGFQGVTRPSGVMFGASAAASYTVASDGQITAVSPLYDPGTVDLTVTNNGITSVTSSADQFTFNQCTSVSETTSPLSPTTVGYAVFISATAIGCPNPLYRFWIKLPTTNNWYIVQDYSATRTYNWYTTAQVAGPYAIGVWVRDANSLRAGCGMGLLCDALTSIPYTLTASVCDPRVCPPPALCTSVSPSATPPSQGAAGTPVMITGSAVTCPNPVYEFWMRPSGSSTWTSVQAYSTIPTYNWISTGASPDTYYFGVWARDASSSANSDAVASIGYTATVTACGSTVSESPSPASPSTAGTQVVSFVGAASGCPNPLYEFWIRPSSSSTWQLARGYTTNGTFNWHTSGLLGGTYHFGVWARDASSSASFDANASVLYTVIAASCISVNISAAPSSVAHGSGTHVTLTGTASGCTHANPLYEFWMRPATSSTWQWLQGYSTSATYGWNSTGAAVGTVYFGVWAQDAASSTGTFDANNNTTVTVT